MNKLIGRRLSAVFFIFVLLTAMISPAFALDDPAIQAKAALLADPSTGQVFYEKNADAKMYPASTTKVMTALLTLENAKLTDTVTCTAEDLKLEMGSSNADIKLGETLTVEDLLYCLLLPSANEAANMLARHVGGSIPDFVVMMNERAKALGCTGTHFANPNGLHDDNHYTTARDLYKISAKAMENETFATIVNTAQKTISATEFHEARKVFSTNMLIFSTGDPRYYGFCHGIKTGSTDKAGACLVATATKKGATLLSVVMGCEKDANKQPHSFPETRRLFEWGFTNFTAKTLMKKDQSVAEIKVNLSTERDHVVVRTADSVSAVVPIDLDPSAITHTLNIPEEVNAPIRAGDVLGTMTLEKDGVQYGEVNLIAMTDISMSKVLYYADKLENFFQSALFLWIMLALVLIFFLYLLLRTIRAHRKAAVRRRAMRSRGYRRR